MNGNPYNTPIDLTMHSRAVKTRALFHSVIGGVLFFTAGFASGTSYIVDSTGDGVNMRSGNICDDGTGHCTLRAAIQLADARNNGGESIVISVTGPIALTGAMPNLSVPPSNFRIFNMKNQIQS